MQKLKTLKVSNIFNYDTFPIPNEEFKAGLHEAQVTITEIYKATKKRRQYEEN